ncbi:MAG: ribosomal L7Ae/L30e/S12e/Gadd45 family protein [Candidatus Aenigmatarchaeota archaeon]
MATKEELKDAVQGAVKAGTAVLGYKESLKLIRNGSPKMAVVANNAPGARMLELEHDAKVSGVRLEVFDGDSKELGLICGKPFPVLVLAIQK